MTAKIQDWFRTHIASFSGQMMLDEPLSRHTYYRIGGPASVLAIPKSKEDLRILLEGLSATEAPYFIMGQGSNLLVSDNGYNGVIIRANCLNSAVTFEAIDAEFLKIRTGCSVMVSSLLRRASQEGWQGFEFLAGIPGSVGGVVKMNAGTHLGEAKDLLTRVEAISFDLKARSFTESHFENEQLQFAYRSNLFLSAGALVWSAEWKVKKADPAFVKEQINHTLARRKTTQPIEYPSCGSVFKNPKTSGVSAWQVIDRLGLRGFRIGGAQFSEKHSNFIINLGDASSHDVKALIHLAKEKASKELGIQLEEEVIYL